MNSKKALIKSIMKIICLIKMIILLSNDTSLNGILLFWITDVVNLGRGLREKKNKNPPLTYS